MFYVNHKLMTAIAVLFLFVVPFSWAQSSKKPKKADTKTQTASVTQSAPQFFTGNGGKGMSLAVLVPEAQGLAANQNYLPTLVQGVLVGDLSKYSAISVLDRQRLETVLRETESGIYRNESDFGRLGEIASVDYALTGSITRTSTGFAMQIQIVGTKGGNIGVTRASYSGTPTIAEMDNFTGIRRASLELLNQLGVNLTDVSRQELAAAAATNNVNAQTALAQGITAQRGGTEVAALSYYFQAAELDASLLEAVNRSSVLSTNISSGNIGADVRNDIAWRNAWVAKLTETEQFIDNFNKNVGVPYTLFYSDEIKQGSVNYQNSTVTLSVDTYIQGDTIRLSSLESTVRAVFNGLRATRRADTWGLSEWPNRCVTNLNPFGVQRKDFSVVFELLNSRNEVIGRQTIQRYGSYEFNYSVTTEDGSRPGTFIRRDNFKYSVYTSSFHPRSSKEIRAYEASGIQIHSNNPIVFQNVDANKITDNLTIRVASINGTPAETAARNGVLQIRALPQNDFTRLTN